MPVAVRQVLPLTGILACLYATVALVSYDAADPAFSHTGSGGDAVVHNLGGPVGAWLADVLLQVLGHGAWVVGALAVVLGLRLAGRAAGRTGQILAGSGMIWALLSGVAMVDPTTSDAPFPPGGLVGETSAHLLVGLVGPAGAWLVVLGVLAIAGTFLVRLDWQRVAAAIVALFERVARSLAHGMRDAAEAGVQRARSGIATWRSGVAVRSRVAATSVAEPELGLARAADADRAAKRAPETDARSARVDGESPPRVAIPIEPELGPLPTATFAPPDALDFGSIPSPPDPGEDASVPTQVGERALVEVEWEPTSAADPPTAAEAPWAADPPTAAEVPSASRVQPVVRGADPSEPADRESVFERAALSSSIDDAGEEASGTFPPLDPVGPPPDGLLDPPEPAHVGRSKAARTGSKPDEANRIAITPGELVAGGCDDGGVAVVAARGSEFELPHLGLLDAHERDVVEVDERELRAQGQVLQQKLADFGVEGRVTAIRPGPVITTFEYVPAPGVKLSKISALSADIAMALKALRVRIVAPIPGKGVVGFEIPNKRRQIVWIRDVLSSSAFRKGKAALPLALGKTVEGKPRVADLARMPHLLIGGTTGSGKSVGMNAMLLSMLYTRTPEELRLLLVDPKMLEFELYRDIPHLLHPVVTDAKLASAALKWACEEMDERYKVLSRWQTRNIASYNRKVERELESWTPAKARRYAPPDLPDGEFPPIPRKMPYLVIVIDELADLMMVAAKDVEESIIRLAQKARAAGIHLIVATQRPSVNVITGLIKANMPSRIAFQVRTKVDSRTILDANGAENLLGKGDMLYLPPGVSAIERLHGPFCSDEEVRAVTDFLRSQGRPVYEADIQCGEDSGLPAMMDDEEYDEYYEEAVAYVCQQGKASSSMIQRRFKIGYNRAARIIELMEREGVVGPADGARPREVLIGRQTG